ncbi:hypothetical protein D3C76_1358350 [compost metagenome]
MDPGIKPKAVATFFFVAFWVMFVIATGAVFQRDKARELHADVDGKSLVCRFEEKH